MHPHTIKTFRAALLAALLAVSPIGLQAAQAATLVDHGTFTTDTSTGLDWLDLTDARALGNSFNTVTGLFGSTLAGWRYATLAEIARLYDDAGGVGPYAFSNPLNGLAAEEAAAALLLSLLGDTGASGLPAGSGITADPDTSGGPNAPSAHFLAFYSHLPPTSNYLIAPLFISQEDSASSATVGSFLVRTAVPEPASLLLFGAGSLTLLIASRFRPAGSRASRGTSARRV